MAGGSSQNNSFGAFIPFQSCIFPPPTPPKKKKKKNADIVHKKSTGRAVSALLFVVNSISFCF